MSSDHPTKRPRRAFLGAVTASSAVACVSARPSGPPALSSAELDEVLTRLDRSTTATESAAMDDFLSAYLPRSGRGSDYTARVEPTLRRTMKTLVATGGLGEVINEPNLAPAVRERTLALGPEMAMTVGENLALLRGLSPRGRRRVVRTLRARPQLPLAVAAELDQVSHRIGVAPSTRFKLRRLATRVSSTLPRQSAGGYLEDVSQEMGKLLAYRGVDLRTIDRFATDTQQAVLQGLGDEGQPSVLTPPGGPRETDQDQPPDKKMKAKSTAGRTMMAVGGGMMFGALVSLGLGAAFSAATGSPMGLLVGGLTIGGLLLIGGLIVIITGGIIHAAS